MLGIHMDRGFSFLVILGIHGPLLQTYGWFMIPDFPSLAASKITLMMPSTNHSWRRYSGTVCCYLQGYMVCVRYRKAEVIWWKLVWFPKVVSEHVSTCRLAVQKTASNQRCRGNAVYFLQKSNWVLWSLIFWVFFLKCGLFGNLEKVLNQSQQAEKELQHVSYLNWWKCKNSWWINLVWCWNC